MRHPLLVYCVGIFAASWALQIAGLYAVGGNVENTAITPWLMAAMFTPALGVLMLMGFCKAVRKDVLWRPTWRTLAVAPYAVFIPTLVAFGIVATFVLTGWGRSSFFAFSSNGVRVIGGPWVAGSGPTRLADLRLQCCRDRRRILADQHGFRCRRRARMARVSSRPAH